MLSGIVGMFLTSISYFMLGKIVILKTEVEVPNASAIIFCPFGITERLYSVKLSSKSRTISLYALNLG
jgi:hypothetical protein